MSLRLCAIAAACLLAFGGTAIAQTESPAAPSLEGTVQIGALLPITGDGSLHGQDIRATLDLAESEINQYLQERGAGWELDIVVEDTQTSPVIALENIEAIKAHGIDLVIGTYSSAELRNVMGYATSNNMLMISFGSTATSLAIPGDKIFRFIPDSAKQAPVNARIFEALGITHVIPVWRGDAWGDDLAEATKESFELLGGTFHDGVRYNPEAVEFSTEIALLSDQVEKLAKEVDRNRVGILLLTFSEGIHIAQYAYQYENLYSLEWVGIDTLLNVGGPGSDPISSEFFDSQLTVSILSPPENPVYDRVASYVLETLGRQPIIYSISAYEAAWALGLSMYAADSTDPELIAAAMPGVLEERSGALGKIVLNEAGDLTTSNYVIQQLEDNEWIHTGSYGSASDRIVWNEDPASAEKEDSEIGATEGDAADAGSQGGGGCLIATAAFGSELAPQVQFLREVRDGMLLQTDAGHSFMDGFNTFYYSFSPAVADLEREIPELRWVVRTAITPAVYILGMMSAADPDSEASVIILGTAAMLAMAGVYVAAPVFVAWVALGRLGNTRSSRLHRNHH